VAEPPNILILDISLHISYKLASAQT